MYFLYIIKSISKDWHYIGITEDIEKRIEKHNSASVRSTKAYRPFILIHKEVFSDKQSARRRKIFLKKTARARKEIFEKQNAPIV